MKTRKVLDLSLFVKLMIIFTLVCLVLSVGSFFILRNSYQAYDEQLYIHTAQVYTSFVEQVEMEFSQIDTVTLSMIANETVMHDLATLRDADSGSSAWRQARVSLAMNMQSYMYGINLFSSFRICTAKGEMVGNQDGMTTSDEVQSMVQQAAAAQGKPVVVLSGNKVYYIRQIVGMGPYASQVLGTVIGRVNILKLMNDSINIYEGAGFGLKMSVQVDDTVIYSNAGENPVPLEQDGWQIQGNLFVTQCTSARGWKFLLQAPYDEIHRSIRVTESQSIWLTVIIGALALLCSYYMVKRAIRRLNTLMTKIDAYRNGVLPEQNEMELYQSRHDEFDRLHRHFDRMAYDNKKLNDENYAQMLLQKEAQYKQLQQQIQPHFIFNTMSLITWIAYDHEDMEIVELSTSLSRLLRSAMSFNERTVQVRDELQLVEDYMLIQTKRFGSRLKYEMCIPEELMQAYIPQLTIQPIVENSIKYALEEILDTCVIRLSGRREGDTAVLIVEDNGPGMDTDILSKLESEQITAKGHGVGLLNIQKRIQLLFSEEYGLTICRVEDQTQVQIRVPFTKE